MPPEMWFCSDHCLQSKDVGVGGAGAVVVGVTEATSADGALQANRSVRSILSR